MRTVLTAILFLAACSSNAQSETRYDVYILEPRDGGADIYAFSGGRSAVALAVRGCGDVALLPDAAAVTAQLSARRADPNTDVITIIARGSRTDLGSCESAEPDEPDDEEHIADDADNLVVIEDASARQTRAMIRSLDAAPSEVRDQIIATLGLD